MHKILTILLLKYDFLIIFTLLNCCIGPFIQVKNPNTSSTTVCNLLLSNQLLWACPSGFLSDLVIVVHNLEVGTPTRGHEMINRAANKKKLNTPTENYVYLGDFILY